MRSTTNFLAGLLLAGVLALTADTSFARGGGSGGHFGGGSHFGGGHLGGLHGGAVGRGFGAMGHGFHGLLAPTATYGHRGGRWWRYSHQGGYYGYYAPFDYGLDAYDDGAYPYYNDSLDVQPMPSGIAPEASIELTKSVQKELAQHGYYHGSIDGIAGSETRQAILRFQSVDHLPVTGRIDGATLEALHLA